MACSEQVSSAFLLQWELAENRAPNFRVFQHNQPNAVVGSGRSIGRKGRIAGALHNVERAKAVIYPSGPTRSSFRAVVGGRIEQCIGLREPYKRGGNFFTDAVTHCAAVPQVTPSSFVQRNDWAS